MNRVTFTSAGSSNLSQTSSYMKNSLNFHTTSFASYSNGSGKISATKHVGSDPNLSPIITSTKEDHLHLGGKDEHGEIGVFGAEKYFNGGMDMRSLRPINTSTKKHQYTKAERLNLDPVKPKITSRPPSVHSESSWNSQKALLQTAMKHPSGTKANRIQGKSFLSSLVCKCSCYDKNSIDLSEDTGELSFKKSVNFNAVQSKTSEKHLPTKAVIDAVEVKNIEPRPQLIRENCFTFPTSKPEPENSPVKMHFSEEEKYRMSLEVFGSPITRKRIKSFNLERRLTMLSSDATPRVEETIYDDAESDASSDLFEIESLTGRANPFLARQQSGGTSGCVTPTTGYAPSEASIEWSVVTASAADFSVMSDCEEQRPSLAINSPVRMNREILRQHAGILSGCKSQKPVSVAGDVYRTIDEVNSDLQIRRRSDLFVPMTRFEAGTKVSGFGSRQRHHDVEADAAHRPRFSRGSDLLYIQ